MWTPDKLLAFEHEVATEFDAGGIKSPVHLAGGNEEQLLHIFNNIEPYDWVLSCWRSHYHCLLKSVPAEEVKAAIRNGRSIALCFPRHKVLSSALVGGICPIAIGLAWGIKKRAGKETIHVFLGDMAAETGIYHESRAYAAGHDLPVVWHIEDNGLSVCTDTQAVWGRLRQAVIPREYRYRYRLTRPHVGTGQWVRF